MQILGIGMCDDIIETLCKGKYKSNHIFNQGNMSR